MICQLFDATIENKILKYNGYTQKWSNDNPLDHLCKWENLPLTPHGLIFGNPLSPVSIFRFDQLISHIPQCHYKFDLYHSHRTSSNA